LGELISFREGERGVQKMRGLTSPMEKTGGFAFWRGDDYKNPLISSQNNGKEIDLMRERY